MAVTATEIPTGPIHRLAKELVASSGFLLARLGFGFKAKAIAKFEQAGFEIYDYSVLAILAESAQETQASIANMLAVDPSRLVALLDSLEERALIVRQRDPQDRRRHLVSITAAGRRQLSRLREMVKELEEAFLAPLEAESRKTFQDLLSQLAAYHDPRCSFSPAQAPSQVPEP